MTSLVNQTFSTVGLNDCSAILNLVKGKTKEEVLSFFKLNSSGAIRDFNSILEYLSGQPNLKDATTLPNYEEINRYLNTFKTSQKSFLETVVNCMTDARDSSAINTWNEQKEKTSESKLRLDSLKSPEQNVSYYEGWFPLFRPMKEVTLFALFGTSLALILASIVFFLSLSGVSFNIILPGGNGGLGFELPKAYLYGGLVTGAAVAGLSVYKGW